jgi:hypothetical protein
MGAQAVDWMTVNNRVVGDWNAVDQSGVVYRSTNEADTYSVGDKVLSYHGGKWIPATITKPPHKATGNYGVRFKHPNPKQGMVNTVSSPGELKPNNG